MNINKRTLLIFVLPVALVYLIWAGYMFATQSWALFLEDWYMTLTMIFGSFIAGGSSEGGGAVAYPVMTLGFRITPDVARNFSLAIQSIGMTAASLWIIARRITIEKTYLWLAMSGGTAGLIAATFYVVPLISSAYAKMMFVSFWLSFGIALFVINHVQKRDTCTSLSSLTMKQKTELCAIGFLGGTLSAIFGNGIDICTFAFVTLKYNLSEKIATPTSVILMASNAVVGTVLHSFVMQDMQQEAIDFWLVCIPVVMLGAPFGAFIVNRINRISIAYLLYVIIIAQFVAAVFIIRPRETLMLVSSLTFLAGIVIFFLLTKAGAMDKIKTELED